MNRKFPRKLASGVSSLALCILASVAPAFGGTKSNLLKSPGDFSDKAWASYSKDAVVAEKGLSDPDGTNDAQRVTIGPKGFVMQTIKELATPDHVYIFSIWMKSATGEPQAVQIAAENSPPDNISVFTSVKVGDQWERHFLVVTCPANPKDFRVSVRSGDVLLWHPQLEDATDKTVKEPGDYSAN